MATETMDAEKMRRKPFVQLVGTCYDCGQPVVAGQEFLRTDHGIQHALVLRDHMPRPFPDHFIGNPVLQLKKLGIADLPEL